MTPRDARSRSSTRYAPAPARRDRPLARYVAENGRAGIRDLLDYLERALEALHGARAAAGPSYPTARLDHARRAVSAAIREAREASEGPTPYELLEDQLCTWLDQWRTWWEDRDEAPFRPNPPWHRARFIARRLGLDCPSDPPVR